MEGAVPQGIALFLLLATQRLTRRPSSTNASVNRFPVSASIPMVTSVTMCGSEGASCAKVAPMSVVHETIVLLNHEADCSHPHRRP